MIGYCRGAGNMTYACQIFTPVFVVQVADHHPLRSGGMHEIIVHQVNTYMGNVAAVNLEENQVAF